MRLTKFAIIAFLAVVFNGDVSANSPDCTDNPCLRIGSFNIELLGSNRRRRGTQLPKRSEADLRQIANLISTVADYDVVALQEINTDSDQWRSLKMLLDDEGYSVAIEGTTSERNQFLVLLYRRETVRLEADSNAEMDLPTAYNFGGGCKYEGLRKPITARFKAAAFDFQVIAVHLKSKSSRNIPSDCPDKIRKRQADDLLTKIDTLVDETNEADVILVGDFNAAYHESSLGPFSGAGYHSQMRYRAENSGRYSYRKGSNSLIDHVMFNPSITTEFVRRSGFVYLVEGDKLKDHIRRISDHMPIWSSFYANKDED